MIDSVATFRLQSFNLGASPKWKMFVESSGFGGMFFCKRIFSVVLGNRFKIYIHKTNGNNCQSYPL